MPMLRICRAYLPVHLSVFMLPACCFAKWTISILKMTVFWDIVLAV
jgi:hypothetical protein